VFFAFQPISLDSTRETSKNKGKSTLWTFPDHTRPKGQAQKRLPDKERNERQKDKERTKDEKAYNMKRSCLKKASSFCSICKPYAKNEKPWKLFTKL
jgi:hypothetical protein